MTSTSIQQFQHEQFGTIRTTTIDGEPWFVAKDVCDALEIGNSRQALSYLDEDEKGVTTNDTLGGAQKMNIISEAGLYSLVLRSRKPEAKAFKRWVTHEVLPSIRRHGVYATESAIDEMLSNPETMIRTLQALKAEREKAARLEADKAALMDDNAAMLPKSVAYDSFIEGDGTYSITSAARFLAQMDRTINRKRLYALLRADGIICKNNRCPTKKGIDRGYAKQLMAKKTNGEAAEPYAHLTQKGLDWCIRNYVSMPSNATIPSVVAVA
jgi:anti-repressor protein